MSTRLTRRYVLLRLAALAAILVMFVTIFALVGIYLATYPPTS